MLGACDEIMCDKLWVCVCVCVMRPSLNETCGKCWDDLNVVMCDQCTAGVEDV